MAHIWLHLFYFEPIERYWLKKRLQRPSDPPLKCTGFWLKITTIRCSNDFHAIFTLFLPPPFASPCVQTPSSFPSASLSSCGRVKKVLISMGIASQSRLSCPKMAVVVVVYGSADFLLYFTTLSKKKDLFPRLGSLQLSPFPQVVYSCPPVMRTLF